MGIKTKANITLTKDQITELARGLIPIVIEYYKNHPEEEPLNKNKVDEKNEQFNNIRDNN